MRSAHKPYFRFLCACLRRDNAQARTLVQTAGWSWDELFEASVEEAILPTLASLAHDGLDLGAPSDVSRFLEEVLALSR